jgi:hypothetical protein
MNTGKLERKQTGSVIGVWNLMIRTCVLIDFWSLETGILKKSVKGSKNSFMRQGLRHNWKNGMIR